MPGHVAGIDDAPPPPPLAPPGPVAVRLEHVTLRYPGAPPAAPPALNDVTLDIPAGSLVAVTGPVGAGKSALARALLGLHPLEQGRVLLDARPVESFSGPERAARVGYLPQDAFLFSGTIRENVLAADSAEIDAWACSGELPAAPTSLQPESTRLQSAVGIAALADDLASFPDGLDSEIGESGVRVSGGQRQRIALARALAAQRRTPGLLVLDDPFSAVDVDTEARIATALRQAVGPTSEPEQRATIVLCSHRLAVFPQADRVVVLDRGPIVEQGAHADLLEAGGLYSRIYRAQQQAESILASPGPERALSRTSASSALEAER